MNDDNKMGTDAWLRHEELLATMPNAISVGVGQDAIKQTGMTGEMLGAFIKSRNREMLSKPGAFAVETPTVRLYVLVRNRTVDVGTRADFIQMKWDKICELVDAQAAKEAKEGS